MNLVDSKREVERIQKQFCDGLSVLVGLIKNKRNIFNRFRIGDEEKREQLESIIENQITLLNFYKNEGIPILIESINLLLRLLKDKDTINKLKSFNKFLIRFEKILIYSQKEINQDLEIIHQQLEILQSRDINISGLKSLISKEERKLTNLFSKYSEIDIREFLSYVSYLKYGNDTKIEKISKEAINVATFTGAGYISGSMIDHFFGTKDGPLTLTLIMLFIAIISSLVKLQDKL